MINPRQALILIVDDEQAIRDLLASRFAIFGFQTAVAASGDEAWRLLCSDPSIRVLITDLALPGMSGQELIAKSKAANPEFPRAFAITGQSHWSAEHLFGYGADGLLLKPFDARALLNITRNSLLALEERLRYPPYTIPKHELRLTFPSLAAAFASGEFALGRGGLYALTGGPLPAVGELVGLNINCGDLQIHGCGQVRWSRLVDGCIATGVEFVYIRPDVLPSLERWLTQTRPIAYLPTPQIVSSMPSTAKLKSTG